MRVRGQFDRVSMKVIGFNGNFPWVSMEVLILDRNFHLCMWNIIGYILIYIKEIRYKNCNRFYYRFY